MFSLDQKKQIAAKVEETILSFNHPEMPTEKPDFTLNIKGKESWSWAEIKPNWTFNESNQPGINPHNEAQAERSA
jgi:hypothetical protein